MKTREMLKMTGCFVLGLCFVLTPIITDAKTVELPSGINLYYKTSGTGKIPIVFVHGYTLSSDTFDKVLKLLPSQYRAYAYDLRGYGQSDKPATGYSYEDMSNDLIQFLDAMKIKKAVFVGHSLGGMFLQHFAVWHPERISALIISDSPARNQVHLGMNEAIQKLIDSYGTPEANRKIFSKSMPRYFDAANLQPGDLEKFIQIGLKASNDALKQHLRLIVTAPPIPPDQYNTIKVPTLIIFGSHDPIAKFKYAVSINDAIAQSRIFVVERSGHTPMWERPERWTEGVIGFLDDIQLN